MSLSEKLQSENKWDERLENRINELTLKKFNYNDFECIEKIRIGDFGKVYRAFSKSIKKFVTMKKVKIFDENLAKIFINELKLRQDVKFNNNILQLYGISMKGSQKTDFFMLIEYADVTLRQYLEENFQLLNWDNKLRMAKQITSAIFYLHGKDIIIKDLHPGIIFIKGENIKLDNFGLLKKPMDTSNTQITNIPVENIPYIDPECFKKINKEPYYERTKKSDIYCLGVLLWELTSGYPPFSSDGYNISLIHQILEGLRETSMVGTPQEYTDIYEVCWNENPDDRPDIVQVKESLDLLESDAIKEFELNALNKLYQFIFDQFCKGLIISELTTCIDKFIESNQTTLEQIFNLLINCQETLQNVVTLGIFYHCGIGTTKDIEKAFQCFLNSAADDSLGQFFLAHCYRKGVGIAKDYKKAFQWFLKSAESGNSAGQNDLGFYCYHKGKGTAQNNEKAFELFLKSAEGENHRGQCYLGYFYACGIGTTQDFDKAFQLYLKSAEGGNSNGQYNLGSCYRYGKGTIIDYEKAFQYYQKSAEGGFREGQKSLGICYRDGIGTTKNEEKAEYWINKSKIYT